MRGVSGWGWECRSIVIKHDDGNTAESVKVIKTR